MGRHVILNGGLSARIAEFFDPVKDHNRVGNAVPITPVNPVITVQEAFLPALPFGLTAKPSFLSLRSLRG